MPKICSIPNCGKPMLARGWCPMHYRRWMLRGDPNSVLVRRCAEGEPLAWIEKHVSYSGDDCISWPYSKTPHGYGHLQYGGMVQIASRVMCMKAHGEPPSPDHQAAHSCGNGKLGCMNPRHLRWATPTENTADAFAHGTFQFGERHANAKLSDAQVADMRAKFASGYYSGAALARIFRVAPNTVSKILSNEQRRRG